MLNADIVIAASNARFKLPEASLGVFVTGGLVATLPAYAGGLQANTPPIALDEDSPGRRVEDDRNPDDHFAGGLQSA